MKKIACLAAGLLLAGTAHAIPVSFTDTQSQTVDGQDFVFNFASAPASDGGLGLLEIEARGDFTIGIATEYFDYDIEGIVSGSNIQATAGNLIQSFNFFGDDNWFGISVAIAAADLTSILADSLIQINVNFSDSIELGLTPDSIGGPNPFAKATFSYNSAEVGDDQGPVGAVPEPATIALMGMGLVGMGLSRKLKKA